jgi:thioredoxin-related protein
MTTALLLSACLLGIQANGLQSPATAAPEYVPVREYDATRNAVQDLQMAEAEARKTGKRVLMQIGGAGAWCDWCHFMDAFFQAHPELVELRDKNFVTVKISVSVENQNREVLSHYPKIFSYPHFFVLDDQGNLIQSQQTSELEMGQGNTYDAQKVKAFLLKWGERKEAAPQKTTH